MATTAHTHLMYQGGHAREAVDLYVSLLPNSRIVGEAGPVITFELCGTTYTAFDSPVPHEFDFTPSTSTYVTFDDAEALDAAAAALAEDGAVLMPLGEYDFAPRFTWVADRFGVSWQLALAA